MTAPTAGSTPRPWHVDETTDYDWEPGVGTYVVGADSDTYIAFVGPPGQDGPVAEDAALIVYAVNHIEAAEARILALEEALREQSVSHEADGQEGA